MTAKRPRRTVLIVEAYAPLREALAEMLIEAIPAVAVLQAGSAEEAVAAATGNDLALAIVDAQAGSGRAFAIIRRLRDVRPELPILALGHACEVPYARRARAAGAVEYLRKTAPPEHLVRAAWLILETGVSSER